MTRNVVVLGYPGLAIAGRRGFGTAATLRGTVIRRLGISPGPYRRTFA